MIPKEVSKWENNLNITKLWDDTVKIIAILFMKTLVILPMYSKKFLDYSTFCCYYVLVNEYACSQLQNGKFRNHLYYIIIKWQLQDSF